MPHSFFVISLGHSSSFCHNISEVAVDSVSADLLEWNYHLWLIILSSKLFPNSSGKLALIITFILKKSKLFKPRKVIKYFLTKMMLLAVINENECVNCQEYLLCCKLSQFLLLRGVRLGLHFDNKVFSKLKSTLTTKNLTNHSDPNRKSWVLQVPTITPHFALEYVLESISNCKSSICWGKKYKPP